MLFTREELKDTLRKLDLSIPPLTEEGFRETVALLAEMRPFVERAERVEEVR